MKTTKEVKVETVFNESKRKLVKDFIKKESMGQSKERLLRNKLLSKQYKIEDELLRSAQQVR